MQPLQGGLLLHEGTPGRTLEAAQEVVLYTNATCLQRSGGRKSTSASPARRSTRGRGRVITRSKSTRGRASTARMHHGWDCITCPYMDTSLAGVECLLKRQTNTRLVEYEGCEERFAEYWENAFRWTCCGGSLGEGTNGCNTASFPCSCNFCRGALPERLRKHTQASYGLCLQCGPDQ